MQPSKKIGLLLIAMSLVFSAIGQSTLSPEERLFGLSKLWQEVNYNFAYFDQVADFDWDQAYTSAIKEVSKKQSDLEYYQTLERLVAQLNDGHTNIYMPDRLQKSRSFPKVKVGLFENKFRIIDIDVELENKIPLGSEIIKVNGQPTHKHFEEKILPYIASSTEHARIERGLEFLFYGPVDRIIEVQFQSPINSKIQKIQLSRDRSLQTNWIVQKSVNEDFTYKSLNNNIAYVSMNTFGNEDIISKFREQLPLIGKAKSLILDLRMNGGGLSSTSLEIAKHLVAEDYILDTKWKSRNHIASHKAWGTSELSLMGYDNVPELENFGNMDAWIEVPADKIPIPESLQKLTIPTIILTSSYTASAAEDFLVFLDGQKHITLLGTPTFGSTGQPIYFSLPGGGFARVCAKRDMYPDGREFVGVGISPDIHVKPSLETAISIEDELLQQAIEHLTIEQQ